jgi:hypothetical protein
MAVNRAYNGNDPPGAVCAGHINKSGGTGRGRAPGADHINDARSQTHRYPGRTLGPADRGPVKNRSPMQKLGDDSF